MATTHRIDRRLKMRDLQLVEAIAAHGSMARAAEYMGLSQPAISKIVAELERDLGAAIFERGARGVSLTPSGEVLRRRGRIVLDELRRGLQEIENLADPFAGEARIGAIESLSPFTSTVIERMSRRYRKITYQITFLDADALIAALRDRRLDFVISRAMPNDANSDLDVEILFRDWIVIVASPDHPLARRRNLSLADLVDEAWALGFPDTFLGQAMLKAFRAQGLPMPRTVVTTSSIQQRLDLMKSGRFLTVYSSAMMGNPVRQERIKALPIDLGDVAGPMAAITLRGRENSGAVKLALDEARVLARSIASKE